MTAAPPSAEAWGTCRLCGDAVPPGAAECPICAQSTTAALPTKLLRRRSGRWLRLVQSVRVLLVLGVVVGLAIVLLQAVWSGPPSYPDPLTTQGTHLVPAGNISYLSGSITGEDYITGNYTVLSPVGANVTFAVYNVTEFIAFYHHEAAQPQLLITGHASGRIVFAAPYTDTFFFVWESPFPASTGPNENVYVVTTYETNVVLA